MALFGGHGMPCHSTHFPDLVRMQRLGLVRRAVSVKARGMLLDSCLVRRAGSGSAGSCLLEEDEEV